jgi:hypothetical protein
LFWDPSDLFCFQDRQVKTGACKYRFYLHVNVNCFVLGSVSHFNLQCYLARDRRLREMWSKSNSESDESGEERDEEEDWNLATADG